MPVYEGGDQSWCLCGRARLLILELFDLRCVYISQLGSFRWCTGRFAKRSGLSLLSRLALAPSSIGTLIYRCKGVGRGSCEREHFQQPLRLFYTILTPRLFFPSGRSRTSSTPTSLKGQVYGSICQPRWPQSNDLLYMPVYMGGHWI